MTTARRRPGRPPGTGGAPGSGQGRSSSTAADAGQAPGTGQAAGAGTATGCDEAAGSGPPVPDRPLVLVDVQNCFSDGFTPPELPVAGVAEVDWAGLLDCWLDGGSPVVATRDWHVDPGEHFAPPGTDPDFATTWPRHGVAGTPGAELVPPVARRAGRLAALFHKGQHGPGYSGFDGTVGADGTGQRLHDWLRTRGADGIAVAGVATSHCVRATVLDALRLGYAVDVLADYCVGVTPEAHCRALAELRAAGATIRSGAVRARGAP